MRGHPEADGVPGPGFLPSRKGVVTVDHGCPPGVGHLPCEGDTSESGDAMFETVVIGVDGRPGGRDAIALAVRLAAPEARPIPANVPSDGGAVGYGASQSIAQARARAEQVLSSERAKLGERADTIVVYSG